MKNLAQNSYPRHFRPSFTLIEVMITIGIMSILMITFIAIINPARQFAKARDSNRKSDLAVLTTALEQYYADNNQYPPTPTIECVEQALVNTGDCATGSTYLKTMISDSEDGYSYCYNALNDGQDYVLCARLEVGEEDVADSIAEGDICTEASPPGNANYCVTNPF